MDLSAAADRPPPTLPLFFASYSAIAPAFCQFRFQRELTTLGCVLQPEGSVVHPTTRFSHFPTRPLRFVSTVFAKRFKRPASLPGWTRHVDRDTAEGVDESATRVALLDGLACIEVSFGYAFYKGVEGGLIYLRSDRSISKKRVVRGAQSVCPLRVYTLRIGK